MSGIRAFIVLTQPWRPPTIGVPMRPIPITRTRLFSIGWGVCSGGPGCGPVINHNYFQLYFHSLTRTIRITYQNSSQPAPPLFCTHPLYTPNRVNDFADTTRNPAPRRHHRGLSQTNRSQSVFAGTQAGSRAKAGFGTNPGFNFSLPRCRHTANSLTPPLRRLTLYTPCNTV
jgi:hypothetical protein